MAAHHTESVDGGRGRAYCRVRIRLEIDSKVPGSGFRVHGSEFMVRVLRRIDMRKVMLGVAALAVVAIAVGSIGHAQAPARGAAPAGQAAAPAASGRGGPAAVFKLEDNFLDWRCLLYTSDAADDLLCVDLGGRRIIKKK